MRRFMIAITVALLASPLLAAVARAQAVDPLTLLQQAFDANNRNDFATFFELITDDYVQVGGGCSSAPGGRCVGKEAIRQQFESTPPDARPPTLSILSAQVSGDTVTARVEVRFEPNL